MQTICTLFVGKQGGDCGWGGGMGWVIGVNPAATTEESSVVQIAIFRCPREWTLSRAKGNLAGHDFRYATWCGKDFLGAW